MKTARETALLILYKTEYEGAYPNIELKNAIPPQMPQNDRAFVTALVYGVISRKLTLDYIIELSSKIKLKKISKYIHQILRMGIYQILFMDKIPSSAAVNESVKLAKRYGHGASAGFVNGILRNVLRNGVEYPNISVKYSFPEWICKKWINEFGEEFTEQMMKSFEEPPELIIRPNRLRLTEEELRQRLDDCGINTEIINGRIACKGLNVGKDELYKQGFYTVQDTAAMTAVEVLAPKSGETVIDTCAAPGGKATYMAELMNNEGEIYAFDIYEHKIKLINDSAKRLGIDIIKAQTGDAAVYDERLDGMADKILCDVPCSGLGILRRKPDIKWNRKEDDNFSDIQLEILNNAARYLKSGGSILYSTCTVEKEENGGVTDRFLEKNGGFKKVYEKTFYPHIDNTDGFYICKLER